MERTCKTCQFSKPWNGNTDFECRRKAPTVISNAQGRLVNAEWPRVSDRDWCGEYTADRSKMPPRERPSFHPWSGTTWS